MLFFSKPFSLRNSSSNRLRLHQGDSLSFTGQWQAGHEGGRIVGLHSSGRTAYCRVHSPRSSLLRSTRQVLMLFHWTDYRNWVAFLHVMVLYCCLSTSPSREWMSPGPIPCIGEQIEWGLRYSGNSQTQHHLYLLGFSNLSRSLWGHDGEMGAESWRLPQELVLVSWIQLEEVSRVCTHLRLQPLPSLYSTF